MLRNKKIKVAATAALLLIVAFVLPPTLTRKSKGAVRGAVAPAQKGAVGLSQWFREVGAAMVGADGLYEEKSQLEMQLLQAQAELKRLSSAEAEVLRLKKAFDFYEDSKLKLIPCNVIARDISGWWKSIRIGKGREKGVFENHAVISPNGLVGKTVEVTKKTAEVILICDPACRLSAKIQRLDVYGLVRGTGVNMRGLPKARIEFIDKDVEIRVGDEVVTSGLAGEQGIFPEGLHIGYVEKIYRDDTGLYQFAELAPSATGSLLETVFVIANEKAGGSE